jgi:hypothetical protein
MSLTLGNAVEVFEHTELRAPARGFTRTCHQACRVSPGDLWFPVAEQRPHTVTTTRAKAGSIELTDQFGVRYRYPADALLSTVVLDPRPSHFVSAVPASTPGQP